MVNDESIDSSKLNVHIRRQVDQLLVANKIYDLDGYGWLDADTHDPEYIGHAMWQTNPPLGWEALLGFGDDLPLSNFEEWEKSIAISGADFEGLMVAARLSIGLALFQQFVVRENALAKDSFFQLHLLGASAILGAASDRLRDICISAVFREQTNKYEAANGDKKKARRRALYVSPFKEALEALRCQPEPHKLTMPAVEKLPDLASKIQKFRDLRNQTIHELATEMGRDQKQLVDRLHKKAEGREDEAINMDLIDRWTREHEARRQRKISDYLEMPINWYRLLIDISNHVFIVEHNLRFKISAQPSP